MKTYENIENENKQELIADTRHIYAIRDREAGNVICEGMTYADAVRTLARYEGEDINNDEFTPDFYEIVREEGI